MQTSWYTQTRRNSNDYDGKKLVLPTPTTSRSAARLPTRRIARRWIGLILYSALCFWAWKRFGFVPNWFIQDEPEECVKGLTIQEDEHAAVQIYKFPEGTRSPRGKGTQVTFDVEGAYVPFRHISINGSAPPPRIPLDPGFHDHLPKAEDPKTLSFDCLKDLFTSGTPCPGPPPAHTFDPESPTSDLHSWKKLDVVYAYINNSDPLHHYHHHLAKDSGPHAQPDRHSVAPPKTQKQNVLREFDELKYSLRSVLENFRGSARRVTVIGSEYPFPGCHTKDKEQGTEWTLGQLPTWLGKPVMRNDWFPTWEDNGLELRVVHHSSLFGLDEGGGYDPKTPSFNSLAIESRLVYLQGISDDM